MGAEVSLGPQISRPENHLKTTQDVAYLREGAGILAVSDLLDRALGETSAEDQ
jgi:hypothetical protein